MTGRSHSGTNSNLILSLTGGLVGLVLSTIYKLVLLLPVSSFGKSALSSYDISSRPALFFRLIMKPSLL